MMDELDLLKKDWQKKGSDFPKVSSEEIHKMIWKKSSSIVKWILIISILEIVVPHLAYLFPSTWHELEVYNKMGISKYLWGFSFIQYSLTIFFIVKFYKHYKEISVLDNSKALMIKILKTKKTVTYYVICCLALILIMFGVIDIGIYLSNDISEIFVLPENANEIPKKELKNMLIWGVAISGVFITALVGLVYFLLYGVLLRKLVKNYNELKKLEL